MLHDSLKWIFAMLLDVVRVWDTPGHELFEDFSHEVVAKIYFCRDSMLNLARSARQALYSCNA